MLFVADFAQRGAAIDMRESPERRRNCAYAFACQQLIPDARPSSAICARPARLHLDTVNRQTDRDAAQRQTVAHLDRRFRRSADADRPTPLWRDDVTALTNQ